MFVLSLTTLCCLCSDVASVCEPKTNKTKEHNENSLLFHNEEQAIIPLWGVRTEHVTAKTMEDNSPVSEEEVSHNGIVKMFEETIRAEEEKLRSESLKSSKVLNGSVTPRSKPITNHKGDKYDDGFYNEDETLRETENKTNRSVPNVFQGRVAQMNKQFSDMNSEDNVPKAVMPKLKNGYVNGIKSSFLERDSEVRDVSPGKVLPNAIQNYIKPFKSPERKNSQKENKFIGSSFCEKSQSTNGVLPNGLERKPLGSCQSLLYAKPYRSVLKQEESSLKSSSLPSLNQNASNSNVPENQDLRSQSECRFIVPPVRISSRSSERTLTPGPQTPQRITSPQRNGTPLIHNSHYQQQSRNSSPWRSESQNSNPKSSLRTDRSTNDLTPMWSESHNNIIGRPNSSNLTPRLSSQSNTTHSYLTPSTADSQALAQITGSENTLHHRPDGLSDHRPGRDSYTAIHRTDSRSSLRRDTEDLYYYSQQGRIVMSETENGQRFHCEDEIYDQVGHVEHASSQNRSSSPRRPLSRQKKLAQKQVAQAMKTNGYKLIADKHALTPSPFMDEDSVECTSRESSDGHKRKVQGFSYIVDQSSLERAFNNRKMTKNSSVSSSDYRQNFLNRVNQPQSDFLVRRIDYGSSNGNVSSPVKAIHSPSSHTPDSTKSNPQNTVLKYLQRANGLARTNPDQPELPNTLTNVDCDLNLMTDQTDCNEQTNYTYSHRIIHAENRLSVDHSEIKEPLTPANKEILVKEWLNSNHPVEMKCEDFCNRNKEETSEWDHPKTSNSPGTKMCVVFYLSFYSIDFPACSLL